MAQADVRANGSWTAIYKDLAGERRSAGTYPTYDEALAVATAKESFLRHGGKSIDPQERATMTVRRYWENYYRPARPVLASTMGGYGIQMRKRILPTFGDVRLLDVERPAIRQWLAELAAQGDSQSTRRGARNAFSSLMQLAVEDGGWILENPVRGIRMNRAPRKKIIVLKRPQFDHLEGAMPTEGAALLTYCVGMTGFRFGEVTGLLAGDLNRERRAIMVQRRVLWPDKEDHPQSITGPLVVPGTKPGTDVTREVTISRSLLKRLEAWIDNNDLAPDDLLFPARLVLGRERRFKPTEYELTPEFVATLPMIEAYTGRSYHHGTLGAYITAKCRCDWCTQWLRDYTRTRTASKRAARGLPPTLPAYRGQYQHLSMQQWTEVLDIALATTQFTFRPTMHTLRHTHASWLISKGRDVFEVMRRLGHADITTTQLYVHAMEELDHGAADVLDDLDD